MNHATTLAITERLWQELHTWLEDPNEVAGVLIARLIDDEDGTTLLARDLHRAPASAYLDQRPDRLSLRSTGWVHQVRAAADDGSMAIFVHTHPGGDATFSELDDQVDDDISQPFMDLSGTDCYGALVIAGPRNAVAGRLRRRDGTNTPLTTIRVVGDRLTIHHLGDEPDVATEVHDRQLRALGKAGQAVLRDLRVGVVGAGGTGSPVIEQLVRIGVGHLTVIDDDTVTASSVARGYGSTLDDIGRPKVDVARDYAHRIGLGTDIRPVQGNLRDIAIARQLRHCDVVFCCVDGHAARLVLNRWAYWHLAPVIDIAVLVTSTEAVITGIDGRLTWLAPNASCLLCRGRIDPRQAHLEHLQPDERRRLAEQGYAPELDEPQPSIVTYTTALAALATTELLNRLFGLADTTPTEILVQFHRRTSSLNRRPAREGCFCNSETAWGQGTTEPYLDLTWTG